MVELVKLYYRIGEVATIVGVQPHVLRYWETEFRTIRPQKSGKGQRVYSRKDVEKLLRVKDLLKNQGFTIAGAKKKLREPGDVAEASASPARAPEPVTHVEPELVEARAPVLERSVVPALAPRSLVESITPVEAFAPPPARSPAPSLASAPLAVPLAAPAVAPPSPRERALVERHAGVREALLSLREEMVSMLGELDRPSPRRPKLPSIG